MSQYVVRRLLQALLVLLGASFFTFVVSQATGDPVTLMAPENASQEQLDALRTELGLDKPVLVQYAMFLGNAVQGDLGTSIRQRQSVSKLILERLPATLELAFVALIISLVVSFPIGIFVALRRNTIWDLLGTSLSLIGQAMPNFWLGLMLILVFGVTLRILPISGRGTVGHIILPALTLALYAIGRITRMVRSGMLEVMGSDYVRTARAKGLPERAVIWRHTLRNASIPVVTLIGLEFAALLSGTFIVETVFAWPGLGRLAINAVYQRDFPVVQGAVLISAIVFVLVNLGVDLLYGKLDPRISYE
jgi:peptide/nickel transport system permease protein